MPRNKGCFPFAVALFAMTLFSCTGPQAPPPAAEAGKDYVVDGRRYRVLGTSRGYSQKGLASWYGEDFHGRLTSSGEVYDMEDMTAAHRTLPLGTFVRVRRTDGRGEVAVKVNDRGPFVEGRIIDLSRAAARKLDMLDEGVAQVVVTALGEGVGKSGAGETLLRPRSDYGVGSFSVQVGAFTIRDNAERLVRSMRSRHGEADMSLYDRGDLLFFRVRVGRFSTESQAERFRDQLLRDREFEHAFVVAR